MDVYVISCWIPHSMKFGPPFTANVTDFVAPQNKIKYPSSKNVFFLATGQSLTFACAQIKQYGGRYLTKKFVLSLMT